MQCRASFLLAAFCFAFVCHSAHGAVPDPFEDVLCFPNLAPFDTLLADGVTHVIGRPMGKRDACFITERITCENMPGATAVLGDACPPICEFCGTNERLIWVQGINHLCINAVELNAYIGTGPIDFTREDEVILAIFGFYGALPRQLEIFIPVSTGGNCLPRSKSVGSNPVFNGQFSSVLNDPEYCVKCDSLGFSDASEIIFANPPVDCDCPVTCEPTIPSTEVCDGVDNDCDDVVDNVPTMTTQCGLGVCANTGVTTCADGASGDTCVEHPPLSTDGEDFPGSSMDENCDGIDVCFGHGALVLKSAEKDDDDDDKRKEDGGRSEKRSEKQGEKFVCVCEDGYSSKSDCSTCVKPKEHTIDVCRGDVKVTLCRPKRKRSRKHDDDDEDRERSQKKSEKERECLDEPHLATDVIPGTNNRRCDCLKEVGACFPDPSTTCAEMTRDECAGIGGTYTENGAACPPPTGGCRSFTGLCLSGTYTEYTCVTINANNLYLGDGVPCIDIIDK